ncbi:glycosyltransferase family 2 protein [Microbacterium sp. CPCC 204701]|uniref:glycosyltransferase family 2 protein n=1 Tax=Microbacterium sp. CPCC 204701 TaxID=2493084 RepID=UPI000FDBFC3B|nr:glycosyltransferase family A protein [Microbacterium sp. CPCC 204701]
MGVSETVSIVVATNRSGAYLAEAIDSASAQSYGSFEIVVVDDGSPNPEAIAQTVRRFPAARLIRRRPSGVAAARNAGVRASRGDLIAFLDDDDRWHPGCLEAHVSALAAAPDAVASYCRIQTIDAGGDRVLAPADQVAVRSRAEVAARRTGIFAGNLVVRRRHFEAVGGFAEDLHHAEDLDLILSLAERGRLVFAEAGLVDYRSHGENTTQRYRELVRAIDHVLRSHRDRALASEDPELAAAFEESLARNARFAWWSAARAAKADLSRRRPVAAAGELAWALRAAPGGLWSGVTRRLSS